VHPPTIALPFVRECINCVRYLKRTTECIYYVSTGQINLPVRWERMQPTETVKLVQLVATSEEYITVEKHLKSTGAVNSIVKVS